MEGQENVARVIKSVWLFDGELSPAAFIYINEQQLVGGEPFESLALQHGVSSDSVLLSIRETLADYAKEHIVQISAENG